MKFLVIDDEFSCRAILRRYLKGYGQCDVAVDGLEMIEAFETSLKADAPYDTIFLDIMMPQMDGIEALSKIRYKDVGATSHISTTEDGRIKLDFYEDVQGVAPGQSAVFYDGNDLIGGGFIDSKEE